MAEGLVSAYYHQVFNWSALETFITQDGLVPFEETPWKFIYVDEPDKWSKWRWFPSVQALKTYVLESFNGVRKPIATLNYGQQKNRGERFLALDVDLNDYGHFRSLVCSCGDQKRACADCWNFFMTRSVIPVVQKCLRDTWGFEDIAYVFSGRRGLHVHVRDLRATRMNSQQRSQGET